MNKVCAAGTGSFLEEQAEKLDVNIKREFGKIARWIHVAPLSLVRGVLFLWNLTLTITSSLGVPKDDLLAGLSYSIVVKLYKPCC